MLEKSAGAIIFHRSRGKIEYLLLKHELGHWDFPKGHIEKGEVLLDTVRREVREETGRRTVQFVPGFKEHTRYAYTWNGEKRFKVVTFFLAQIKSKDVTISSEHRGFRWANYTKAEALLTFKNQKDVFKKAQRYVKQLEK